MSDKLQFVGVFIAQYIGRNQTPLSNVTDKLKFAGQHIQQRQTEVCRIRGDCSWVTSISSNSASGIALIFILPAKRCSSHIVPKATLREYKAKKDWLENELRRVRKLADGYDTPELKKQLERTEQYKREWFVKFEDILHKAQTGPMWMQGDRVAEKVAENLHRLDGDAYTLDAFCVMSNHVHTVFKPFLSEAELKESFDEGGRLIFLSEHPGLSKIMHSLKGRAARECNLVLSRTGQFWEHESFDHVIRQGKLMATIRYVLNNPVKAGLVIDWREWKWNYCRNEPIDDL